MLNFLGRFTGLSFQAELLIMNLLGLVNSTLDWKALRWSFELEKIDELPLSQQSFAFSMVDEQVVKTVLKWIVVGRIILAHIYPFAYATNIFSVLTWSRPNFLLPWMLLSFLKNILLELIVIGIAILLRLPTLVVLEFVLLKSVPLVLAAYSWYFNSRLFLHLKRVERLRKLKNLGRLSEIPNGRVIERTGESFLHGRLKSRSLATLLSFGSQETGDYQDSTTRILDDPRLTPFEKSMKILGLSEEDIEEARSKMRESPPGSFFKDVLDESEESLLGDSFEYFSTESMEGEVPDEIRDPRVEQEKSEESVEPLQPIDQESGTEGKEVLLDEKTMAQDETGERVQAWPCAELLEERARKFCPVTRQQALVNFPNKKMQILSTVPDMIEDNPLHNEKESELIVKEVLDESSDLARGEFLALKDSTSECGPNLEKEISVADEKSDSKSRFDRFDIYSCNFVSVRRDCEGDDLWNLCRDKFKRLREMASEIGRPDKEVLFEDGLFPNESLRHVCSTNAEKDSVTVANVKFEAEATVPTDSMVSPPLSDSRNIENRAEEPRSTGKEESISEKLQNKPEANSGLSKPSPKDDCICDPKVAKAEKKRRNDISKSVKPDSRKQGVKIDKTPEIKDFGTVSLAEAARWTEKAVIHGKPPICPKRKREQRNVAVQNESGPKPLRNKCVGHTEDEIRGTEVLRRGQFESSKESEIRALRIFNERTLGEDKRRLEARRKSDPPTREGQRSLEKPQRSSRRITDIWNREREGLSEIAESTLFRRCSSLDKENLFSDVAVETEPVSSVSRTKIPGVIGNEIDAFLDESLLKFHLRNADRGTEERKNNYREEQQLQLYVKRVRALDDETDLRKTKCKKLSESETDSPKGPAEEEDQEKATDDQAVGKSSQKDTQGTSDQTTRIDERMNNRIVKNIMASINERVTEMQLKNEMSTLIGLSSEKKPVKLPGEKVPPSTMKHEVHHLVEERTDRLVSNAISSTERNQTEKFRGWRGGSSSQTITKFRRNEDTESSGSSECESDRTIRPTSNLEAPVAGTIATQGAQEMVRQIERSHRPQGVILTNKSLQGHDENPEEIRQRDIVDENTANALHSALTNRAKNLVTMLRRDARLVQRSSFDLQGPSVEQRTGTEDFACRASHDVDPGQRLPLFDPEQCLLTMNTESLDSNEQTTDSSCDIFIITADLQEQLGSEATIELDTGENSVSQISEMISNITDGLGSLCLSELDFPYGQMKVGVLAAISNYNSGGGGVEHEETLVDSNDGTLPGQTDYIEEENLHVELDRTGQEERKIIPSGSTETEIILTKDEPDGNLDRKQMPDEKIQEETTELISNEEETSNRDRKTLVSESIKNSPVLRAETISDKVETLKINSVEKTENDEAGLKIENGNVDELQISDLESDEFNIDLENGMAADPSDPFLDEQSQISPETILRFWLIVFLIYVYTIFNRLRQVVRSSRSTITGRPYDIHSTSTSMTRFLEELPEIPNRSWRMEDASKNVNHRTEPGSEFGKEANQSGSVETIEKEDFLFSSEVDIDEKGNATNESEYKETLAAVNSEEIREESAPQVDDRNKGNEVNDNTNGERSDEQNRNEIGVEQCLNQDVPLSDLIRNLADSEPRRGSNLQETDSFDSTFTRNTDTSEKQISLGDSSIEEFPSDNSSGSDIR